MFRFQLKVEVFRVLRPKLWPRKRLAFRFRLSTQCRLGQGASVNSLRRTSLTSSDAGVKTSFAAPSFTRHLVLEATIAPTSAGWLWPLRWLCIGYPVNTKDNCSTVINCETINGNKRFSLISLLRNNLFSQICLKRKISIRSIWKSENEFCWKMHSPGMIN